MRVWWGQGGLWPTHPPCHTHGPSYHLSRPEASPPELAPVLSMVTPQGAHVVQRPTGLR